MASNGTDGAICDFTSKHGKKCTRPATREGLGSKHFGDGTYRDVRVPLCPSHARAWIAKGEELAPGPHGGTRKGAGRPTRSTGPTRLVSIRVTDAELADWSVKAGTLPVSVWLRTLANTV